MRFNKNVENDKEWNKPANYPHYKQIYTFWDIPWQAMFSQSNPDT